MKNIILLLSIISLPFLCYSQSQSEMNYSAQKDFKNADAELNKVYQQIRMKYKTDTVFLKNLKTSQHIWIEFRDAEVKTKFPERFQGYYGSVHPMCVSMYLEELTKTRTKVLQNWLNGYKEGDDCNGSVKR